MTEIKQIKNGILHVTDFSGEQPILSRYRLFNNEFDESENDEKLFYGFSDGTLTVGDFSLSLDVKKGGGYDISVLLAPTDRLYGLGDESRKQIMKRGTSSTVWISNITSYGPIPYVMSSNGWAIMINNTYKMTFDLGKSEEDKMTVHADRGALDFYLFFGGSMKKTLSLYTDVTGKPIMLPKSAYGMVLINNEAMNAFEMLNMTDRMHKNGVPLDVMSLEPNWMNEHYNFSTTKTWNRSMFDLPYWEKENFYGHNSFAFSLHNMGCMLSLWLCMAYDIFEEEEKHALDDGRYLPHKAPEGNYDYNDTITIHGQPWFEHLKKFVDNGAGAFKLDASNQVLEFPNRIWAGKYTDEDVHNCYPILYARQMAKGYEEYTGKRLLLNTCGAYPGIQAYAATWAGDTGGGPDVLISLMTYAMCGHTNTSADMYPDDKGILHFGFLMPWTQYMTWGAYMYPNFLEDSMQRTLKYYGNLRNQLFPYIYSNARSASETGYPFLRPLSLVYEKDTCWDDVLNQYMLGDAFLVAVYDMHIKLPKGCCWTDYFTGKIYFGGDEFDYIIPEDRGGALFVKDGSIIVMQDGTTALRYSRPDKYYVHVYLGGDSEFTIYEDDGYSLEYRNGKYCKTKLTLSGEKLTIGAREGSYDGMTEAPELHIIVHDHGENRKPIIVDGYRYKDKGYEVSLVRPSSPYVESFAGKSYNNVQAMRKDT